MTRARLVQLLFFTLLVRPFLAIVLGLNIRRRELLPQGGPAIIVANHNSHLDTVTIMSLFPLSRLHLLRPVAAADYFLKNRLLAWFATSIIRIIAIDRSAAGKPASPLADCEAALHRGEILILFPEGSRGEPEKLERFKRGVAHLARLRPDVPVHPLFLHGLGKALPKGTYLLVPFNCDLIVGEPVAWKGSIGGFMTDLEVRVTALADQINKTAWD